MWCEDPGMLLTLQLCHPISKPHPMWCDGHLSCLTIAQSYDAVSSWCSPFVMCCAISSWKFKDFIKHHSCAWCSLYLWWVENSCPLLVGCQDNLLEDWPTFAAHCCAKQPSFKNILRTPYARLVCMCMCSNKLLCIEFVFCRISCDWEIKLVTAQTSLVSPTLSGCIWVHSRWLKSLSPVLIPIWLVRN